MPLSIGAEALGRMVESRRKAEDYLRDVLIPYLRSKGENELANSLEKRVIYGKLGNLKQLQDEQRQLIREIMEDDLRKSYAMPKMAEKHYAGVSSLSFNLLTPGYLAKIAGGRKQKRANRHMDGILELLLHL